MLVVCSIGTLECWQHLKNETKYVPDMIWRKIDGYNKPDGTWVSMPVESLRMKGLKITRTMKVNDVFMRQGRSP